MAWSQPREWQERALRAYRDHDDRDFLADVTPGAGKTVFALMAADHELRSNEIERIIVVVPREALLKQWADAAGLLVHLDPAFKNEQGRIARDYRGCVVTYQQVTNGPDIFRRLVAEKRTFVVLDEVHHCGDGKDWGDKLTYAFDRAAKRLSLTGTAFRSDYANISFVRYVNGESEADFRYTYGQAVRDGVCRAVAFHAYTGQMRWLDSGEIVETDLASEDLSEEATSTALRVALHPRGEWIGEMFKKAHAHLMELREDVPNAGGLVVAPPIEGYAERYHQLLRDATGVTPYLVTHRDPAAAAKIEAFAKSAEPWIVAIQMVSEGVDIPRLAVGVYATNWKTEMFFRQVVGRFVRRWPKEEHTATLFMPAIPRLVQFAAQIEEERRDSLREAREEYERASKEDVGLPQGTFDLVQPLTAGPPEFHSALLSGEEFTDELRSEAIAACASRGLPQSWWPQIASVIREYRGEPAARVTVETPQRQQAMYHLKRQLKAELRILVGRLAGRTGLPHKDINVELVRRIGVKRHEATVEQLEASVRLVGAWLEDDGIA